MIYQSNKEKLLTKNFLNKGYLIVKTQNHKSLEIIRKIFLNSINKLSAKKITKLNQINKLHKIINYKNLNQFRLKLIKQINSNPKFRYHYFNLARDELYTLVGNDLLMQKKINLSIQLPNDDSSLLPIHSDVWSGDSPFEINLWVPLVNCYKTKSMYILPEKEKEYFNNVMKKNKIKSSSQVFDLIQTKLKWLKINYGEILIFNQNLPHGNVINLENETRFSMNCRFKSYFSPFGDKKIGEFFDPITTRAMTTLGINYTSPIK